MRIKFYLAIFLLTAATPIWPADTGTVMGINGVWTRDDGKPIRLGDAVPGNAVITGSRDGSILIGFGGDVRYRCEQSSCTYDLAKANKQTGGNNPVTRLVAAVKPYFIREPDKYITAVSRGLGDDLQEAVVPIRSDQIELTAAFREMMAGTYSVRLQALTGNSGTGAPLAVQWQPRGSVMVSARGLKPGIYKLYLVDTAGEPTGSEAWILASAPENYEKLAGSFQEAVRITSKWKADLDENPTRAMLRAYLHSLSVSK